MMKTDTDSLNKFAKHSYMQLALSHLRNVEVYMGLCGVLNEDMRKQIKVWYKVLGIESEQQKLNIRDIV